MTGVWSRDLTHAKALHFLLLDSFRTVLAVKGSLRSRIRAPLTAPGRSKQRSAAKRKWTHMTWPLARANLARAKTKSSFKSCFLGCRLLESGSGSFFESAEDSRIVYRVRLGA